MSNDEKVVDRKQTDEVEDFKPAEVLQHVIQRFLDDGVKPAELVYVLASSATDLSIQTSANKFQAISTLLSAINNITETYAKANDDERESNQVPLQNAPTSQLIN